MPEKRITTEPHDDLSTAGMTVRDVARRLRVGPGKITTWIKRGELKATNTALTLSAARSRGPRRP